MNELLLEKEQPKKYFEEQNKSYCIEKNIEHKNNHLEVPIQTIIKNISHYFPETEVATLYKLYRLGNYTISSSVYTKYFKGTKYNFDTIRSYNAKIKSYIRINNKFVPPIIISVIEEFKKFNIKPFPKINELKKQGRKTIDVEILVSSNLLSKLEADFITSSISPEVVKESVKNITKKRTNKGTRCFYAPEDFDVIIKNYNKDISVLHKLLPHIKLKSLSLYKLQAKSLVLNNGLIKTNTNVSSKLIDAYKRSKSMVNTNHTFTESQYCIMIDNELKVHSSSKEYIDGYCKALSDLDKRYSLFKLAKVETHE